MSKDVPMASHLLSSKVFGVSARKLAESVGPPLIVPIILYAIGLPLLVTAPFVIIGAFVGLVVYKRTPEGQRPIRYAAAMARHFRGRTEYLWKPPEAGEHDIAYREPFEGWITGRPNAGESGESDTVDRESTADTVADADPGPASDWPVSTIISGDTHND
ncbi:hypothetical protein [Haloplanus halophilus]|uniref:hypothetical protein n=1 Tax=Haloplanus halophilus TaxID=2949993 RepID=UPI002041053A|nr:hypothetical protein [Haloplanus sp. GDY1]